MIGRLTGVPVFRSPNRLILDVSGVGYEVLISLNTFSAIPSGGEVTLRIHTHVRESEISLYGFADDVEKELFTLLQTVTGIGPRLALGILSGIPAADLVGALRDGDQGRLVAVPGVGKRTAGRMVTELSEKMAAFAAGAPATASGSLRDDARQALMNLGYDEATVDRTVKEALEGSEELTLEEILRRSLKALAGS